MRTTAQPAVNFFTRVSLDTDKRRRRLQEKLGLTGPELIDRALQSLENQVQAEQNAPEAA
jgi:hypothetical protein